MTLFKYDQNGLMPTIIQDIKTGKVLMLAYVNRASLKKMLRVKKTCFYSRSRKTFWIKGESSGHIQEVKKILTDCDNDTLLIQVKQTGGACHLGYRSCFVHPVDSKGKVIQTRIRKIFDPKKVYKK
jgi:phosphoribosyl-AMP cyclohydrolase